MGIIITDNVLRHRQAKPQAPLHEVVYSGTREVSSAIITAISTTIISFLPVLDRKSTRLNSSHVAISYAVFCLKKKKTVQELTDAISKYKGHDTALRDCNIGSGDS